MCLSNIKNILNEYSLILFLYDKELEVSFREKIFSDALNDSHRKIKIISCDELEEIDTLFYLYEFSDKVKMIGRNIQYGNLFNLVDEGIITEEDVIESFLK